MRLVVIASLVFLVTSLSTPSSRPRGRGGASGRGRGGRGRGGGGRRGGDSSTRGGQQYRQSQQKQQQQQQQQQRPRPVAQRYRARVVDCDFVPGSVPRLIHRSEEFLVVSKPAGWGAAVAAAAGANPAAAEAPNDVTTAQDRPSLQQWLLDEHGCDLASGSNVYTHATSAAKPSATRPRPTGSES